MLAAALDQRRVKVASAVVEGESYNPSAELLALWLADRLNIKVDRVVTDGPGLTAVRLHTAGGDVTLERSDGLLAKLSMPDQPDRMVALKRRETSELIAEELRRLDPDDIYAAAVRYGVEKLHQDSPPAGHEFVDARTPAGQTRSEAAEAADAAAEKPAKSAAKAPSKKAASATRTQR
jgi:glucose-6-phosphate dehydrogenase assembly protein OpcA